MADAGAEPAAPHATPMPSEATIGAAPGQPGRLTGWTLYVAAGTAVLLGSTVLVAALQFPFLAVPLGAAAAIAGAAALAATLLDRRRNQEPLHRAGLMATVLDGTDAAHLIATPGGAVVFANAATARLLDGRPVANLVEVERALAGDERSLNRFQRLRRSVESGSPFAVELRRATPDDGSVWWHVSARSLPGLPDHIHWRIEDITTRQEREAILREEQVKLVDFMDHAPVGFYSVDQDGKFVFANATLAPHSNQRRERPDTPELHTHGDHREERTLSRWGFRAHRGWHPRTDRPESQGRATGRLRRRGGGALREHGQFHFRCP